MKRGEKLIFIFCIAFLSIFLFFPKTVLSSNSLPEASVDSENVSSGGGGGGGGGGTIIYPPYGNYQIDGSIYVYTTIDENIFFVGQKNNISVEIYNNGNTSLENISYDIKYKAWNESNLFELYRKNISYLENKSRITENIELQFNYSQIYYIYANLSVNGDQNLRNNEDINYIYVLNGGSYPYGQIYSQNYELIKNQKNNISLILQNYGNETTIDGKYEIYYQKEYCYVGSTYSPCNNLTLLKRENFILNASEYKEIEFEFTPDWIGEVTFVSNISANNSIALSEMDSRYFPIYESGAELDIYEIYLPEYGFTKGEKSNISFEIENYGNEATIDGKYEIYYQKEYCYVGSTYSPCNNLTLLKRENFILNASEYKEIEFEFTPDWFGYTTFIFKINSSNDRNGGQITRKGFQIKDRGPDVRPYIKDYQMVVQKNEQKNISITIYNDGNEIAKNINLSIYLDSYEGASIIYSNIINNITNRSSLDINYTLPPLSQKGNYYLEVDLDLDSDVYYSNNYDYIDLKVVNEGSDLGISDIYSWDLYKGKEASFYGYLNNWGNESVENVEIRLYENNSLIDKSYVSLSRYSDSSVYFYYTPNKTGTYEYKIVVVYPEDTDLSDNQISENFTIYSIKKVNFTFDFDLPNFEKTISSPVETRTILGNNISLELPEGDEYLYIHIHNYSNRDDIYLDYERLNLSSSEKIKAKMYPLITQNNKEIRGVFAIDTSFTYEESYVQREKNVSNLGFKFSNLSYFYCNNFSFSKSLCQNNWSEYGYTNWWSDNHYSYLRFDDYQNYGKTFGAGGYSYSDRLRTSELWYSDVINNLTLEKTYGSIRFNSPIVVSRFRYDSELLQNNVNIDNGRMSISDNMLELVNKPAHLTFRDINMRNPKILRNGVDCSSSACSNVKYSSSKDTLDFDVTGFSTYTIIEGEYCGNNVCSINDGESCSSCTADCETCPITAPPTDNPLVNVNNSCTPIWSCNFGPCTNGQKNLVCIDARNCGTNLGRPNKIESCLLESKCIDNDNDGYGVGIDCLGIDINDNDPGVNREVSEETGSNLDDPKNTAFYIIAGVLILGIIALSGVLIYKYKSSELETPKL